MSRPKIIPLVQQLPDGRYLASCIEIWGYDRPAPSIVGLGEWSLAVRDREAAQHIADSFVTRAEAKQDERLAQEKGELLETLPNGLELRIKRDRPGIEGAQTYIGLYDPTGQGFGPWRGHAHNSWFNGKGERVFRVHADHQSGRTRTVPTEARAIAAVRRAGLAMSCVHCGGHHDHTPPCNPDGSRPSAGRHPEAEPCASS